MPRAGLRLGDLDEKQNHAAHRVAAAALSACGLKMLDEIRIADDFLKAVDERKIGWDGGNYFMSILGTPSETKPWMLQIGGHHIAYNLTFNGGREGATPLFFGSEPIHFVMGDTPIRTARRAEHRHVDPGGRARQTSPGETLGHVHRCRERRGRRSGPGKNADRRHGHRISA